VEEIEDFKAQVSYLKKDLVKSHEGSRTREDLGLSLITRRSPRLTRRKIKDKSKIQPRFFASSAKLRAPC
jgi:hypothetical protein